MCVLLSILLLLLSSPAFWLAEIEKQHLKSKMIVQVHDELVFEVEKGEEDILQQIVRDKMQNAYKMNVPLVVDDSFGKNWYEVK